MSHVTIRMAMAAGLALGAGLLAGVPIATQAQPSANLQLPASTTPAATYAQGRAVQANSAGATSGGALGAGGSPLATATAQAVPGSTLAAIVTTLPDGKQQTLLIDGERRVVSVYHIHPTTGEISLKSVRNIRYDLEMDEFGTSSPSPRDIKAMLNR